MRRAIHLISILLLLGVARAHLGNENDTEIRIYPDRMQVVTRTSISFAWKLLGDRAPLLADDEGKNAARPMLAAEAAGLFKMTAGRKELPPIKSDCQFEVENDVAFVLTYAHPPEWPVEITARFFDSLTNLDSGTVKVFDFRSSRFNSDLEPLAEGVIHQGRPSLSFSLETPATSVEVVKVPLAKSEAQAPSEDSLSHLLAMILLGLGAVLVVVWWLKHRSRPGKPD